MEGYNKGSNAKQESKDTVNQAAAKKKPATLEDLLKQGEMTISKMERPPERKQEK